MPRHLKEDRPIQIGEDVAFQVRVNRFQRLGRGLLILVLIGALLGFAGGGLFSGATTRDAAGRLSMRFDRFARATAPQYIELQVASKEAESDFELWIDAAFLRRIQVDSIAPQPDEQSASGDGVRLRLDVDPPSSLTEVVIRYRPLGPGLLRGRFGVGPANIVIEQFVYP